MRWLNFQCESRVGQDTLISVILPQGLLLERACRRFSKGFFYGRVFSGKKNGYDRIVEVEQNGHVAPAYMRMGLLGHI